MKGGKKGAERQRKKGKGKPRAVSDFAGLQAALQSKSSMIEFEGKLTLDEFIKFTAAMPKNPNLESLSFARTTLGYAAALPLVKAVNACKSLQYLKLKKNGFGNKGIYALCKFLRENRTVTYLALEGNLSSVGGHHVGSLLARNTTIEKIILGHNPFLGEAGLEKVLNGLARNSTVSFVNLGGCKIGDTGVYHVCEMLKKNTSIDGIDLHGSEITDDGVEVIAELLSGECKDKLTSLFLNNNNIGDTGLSKIQTALGKNSRIKSLNLLNNAYSAAAGRALVKAAEGHRSLKNLKVNGDGKKSKATKVQTRKYAKPQGNAPKKQKNAGSKAFETEVGELLKRSNLAMHAHLFYEQRIHTLEIAGELTNDDLKDIGVTLLGDRVRIRKVFDSQSVKSEGGTIEKSSVNYDAFLSHNWGMDVLDRDNHERVRRVNDKLKASGLKTWFDAEKLTGNIPLQMSRGIDSSDVVVVFITEEYMRKVNGDQDDNCKREFQYSVLSKSTQKIIAVVMEASMRSTNAWRGVVGMELGNSLYIDMSTDDLIDANFSQLKDRIQERAADDTQLTLDDDDDDDDEQ